METLIHTAGGELKPAVISGKVAYGTKVTKASYMPEGMLVPVGEPGVVVEPPEWARGNREGYLWVKWDRGDTYKYSQWHFVHYFRRI